jgi:hypothetical protein
MNRRKTKKRKQMVVRTTELSRESTEVKGDHVSPRTRT